MNALTGPGTPDNSTSTVACGGAAAQGPKDYFVSRDGVRYAGSHLIIDLWDAHRLGDPEHVDRVLRQAALDTGATIHTWPERGYAALDIFVCGGCDPYRALPALKAGFSPGRVQLAEQKRGLSDEP
jgi:S-adenosylmethionine decarboxylase